MIPEAIGRYEVQCLLGEGAFGEVYAAWDPVLGRSVAIKMLRAMYSSDAAFMDRFRSEATSVAAMAHPNITLVYDLLHSGSQHGMVMELVHGHTLEHVLQYKTRLGLDQTLAIAAQAVAGLANIHRHGVVHRDIKPSNIMLTDEGVLKIMDFGIARMEGTKRLTRDGNVLGTLAYAPPEQIKSGAGEPRSDQYSLACVIYEMLSGRTPFEANTEFELMQAQIGQSPDSVLHHGVSVPAEVDQALMRALSKKPEDRFETVEAFGKALSIDKVALQANEITRGLILSCDALPPIPEPACRVKPLTAPAHPSDNNLSLVRDSEPKRRYTPLLAIIGAGTLALVVGTAILFDSGAFSDKSTTSVAEHRQTATSMPNALPKSGEPATAPTNRRDAPTEKSEAVPDIPDASVQAETKIAERPSLPPLAAPPKQHDMVPSDEPVKPRPTMATDPEVALKLPDLKSIPPDPKQPAEAPSYEGKIVAWLAGSAIVVRTATGNRTEPRTLYGVRDLSTKVQSQMDDIRERLETFLLKNGRDAKCYTRRSKLGNQPRYLCRVDNIDMALWAIENELALPSADAPDEYRKQQR